jgi:hypothetical protein
MTQETQKSQQILQATGLQPKYFADLVRVCQVVFDPAVGLSGRQLQVDWQSFGMPPSVAENLQILGQRYRYASPYVAIDELWEQLAPETRNWFFEHKNALWRLEEMFPALDED